MNTIKTIVTATVLREHTNGCTETTFSEYQRGRECLTQTVSRRMREIYPNESYRIQRLRVTVVSENDLTGSQTKVASFE